MSYKSKKWSCTASKSCSAREEKCNEFISKTAPDSCFFAPAYMDFECVGDVEIIEPKILTAAQIACRCKRTAENSFYAVAIEAASLGHNNGIQACINAIKTMDLPEINAAGTIVAVLKGLEVGL